MKCLYALSLLLFWQGAKGSNDLNLKYPLATAVIYEPEPGKSALKLTWDPVQNWDPTDPIIGYKVAVWETKTERKTEPSVIDDGTEGVKTIIGDPKIITVSADVHEAVYGLIKSEMWYEYSALAYTKKGEGPLSPINGIKAEPIKKTIRQN